MISAKHVQFIEQHWEAIARRASARIQAELPGGRSLSDAMVTERVQDLFGHLGDWLTAADQDKVALRYEQLGRRRAGEGETLHEIVRALQFIHQAAVDYVRENEVQENAVAMRAESELEYRIDRFFDLVLYHFVRGYEAALRRDDKKFSVRAF